MFKGYYNLTSGMLSQTRSLDVIANNMGNVSTPGYKSDTYVDSTFQEVLFSRVGNRDKSSAAPIGTQSMILAPAEIGVDFSQGAPEQTGQPLDFAISGDGFFQVRGDNGTFLTRNGSFIVDDGGYLALPGHGRVLSREGQPIAVGTDTFQADASGTLYRADGTVIGRIGVFDVAGDYADVLQEMGEGLYTGGNPQPADTPVLWKTLETSNVDMVREMTRMMSSQRALQSAAQVLKIYDQLMGKAVSDVGRV